MNYATWTLNFNDEGFGTGPEAKIAELGFTAQASWVDGEAQESATIMGYVSEPQDESELFEWSFENLTQEQALEFCLAINPEAFILADGTIGAPREI